MIHQPKYKFGQKVIVTIETTDKASDMTFKNDVVGYISAIRMMGTSEKDSFEYGITSDMPRCYHNGLNPFKYVMEDEIVTQTKEDEPG